MFTAIAKVRSIPPILALLSYGADDETNSIEKKKITVNSSRLISN